MRRKVDVKAMVGDVLAAMVELDPLIRPDVEAFAREAGLDAPRPVEVLVPTDRDRGMGD